MAKIRNPLTYMGGGSPTPPTPQPLDPEQVYRDTRPADWLVMPEPQAEEIYFLLSVSEDTVDNVYVNIPVSTSGTGNVYLEFGTSDSSGTFTPDSTLTVSRSGDGDLTQTVPINALATAATSKQKQILAKVSCDAAMTIKSVFSTTSTNYRSTRQLVVEIVGNTPSLTTATWGGVTYNMQMGKLRYVSLSSANFGADTVSFEGDKSLIAVRDLDVSSATSLANLFYGCSALSAIPQLDTNHVTSFSSMFNNCYSLTTIPLLDTSSGTSFTSMFNSCSSLTTIPQLNTSHVTSFSSMFSGCYSLSTIPLLDTSSGTNFSYMFTGCYSLSTIPLLDTSSGTNFSGMFSGCYSLSTIPLLDTSSGTNFQQMFNNCYSLTTIPLLDTSSGTSFTSMFNSCSSLTTIPQLNTSHGTNFSQMFASCSSLTSIPLLDTSSGTNFQQMFNDCRSLSSADFTGYDFSQVSSATGMSILATATANLTIDFGDSWGVSGVLNTGTIIATGFSITGRPCKVRINKTDSMLAIGANATTLFGTSSVIVVYVPDALLATYQADTYWATLGARLKAMSEWSA